MSLRLEINVAECTFFSSASHSCRSPGTCHLGRLGGSGVSPGRGSGEPWPAVCVWTQQLWKRQQAIVCGPRIGRSPSGNVHFWGSRHVYSSYWISSICPSRSTLLLSAPLCAPDVQRQGHISTPSCTRIPVWLTSARNQKGKEHEVRDFSPASSLWRHLKLAHFGGGLVLYAAGRLK